MQDVVSQPSVAPGASARAVAAFLGRAVDACLLGLAFLMPIWFLPVTLDIVEMNKQTLLVVVTMLALVAYVGKALLEKTFILRRSWLHIAVAAFLVGYLVISLFSWDRYLSFVGNVGQMQWAFSTIAAFIFLYFIAVNRIRSSAFVYSALLWFLLGSALAGIYGLLQMLGWFPFGTGGVTGMKTFNSVGTVNTLGTFMVIPTVIAASLILYGCTDRERAIGRKGGLPLFWKIVAFVAFIVGLLMAIIVDFWPVWVSLLFGMAAITAIPFIRSVKACRPKTFILPALVTVLSVVFLIYQTPVSSWFGVPSEVAPSFSHTWQISQGVLRESPLFGSGPGTWLFDYAKYRSIGTNVTQFWTIRFERGISSVFTFFGVLGIVGTALWILLVVSGIVKAGAHLIKRRDCAEWHALATVAAAWLTTVFIAFVYHYNLAHHFAFWLLLALIGALVSEREFVWNERTKPWIMSLLSALLIIIAVGAVSVTWLAVQRLVADANYSASVKAFQRGDSINTSIRHLESAVALNPLNDLYERNLSQAYLIRVGRALQGAPTENDMKAVNADVAKAVDAAKAAAASGPANVDNWSNLAIVYQAIAGFTRGADEFAIANYEEALKREPNNPVFMNEIGKLHVLRSDAYATLLQTSDEQARADAAANVNAELDRALDWFNKAIAAKPDFADAHYDLGLVYERQGKLSEAITKFEEILRADPQDVNTAFQLAVLYYHAGDKDASRMFFEQIVQMRPEYANARWFLSTIYEEEGRYDLAIEQVKEVEKTNPDNTQVKSRLMSLEQAKNAPVPPPVMPSEPLKEDIQTPGQNSMR